MSDDLYLSQKQVIYDLIRYFDMFAGIGGFRAGFDRAGATSASVTVRSTNTLMPVTGRSTTFGRRNAFIQTQETLIPQLFQTLTSYAEASHVRASPSQESERASKTPEAHSSLRFPDWLKPDGLHIFCWKTYPDCLVMTKARRLRPSSVHFRTWGMVSNGWCVTAPITAFPRQESACSLSDILIPDVPEKYYLSQKQLDRLLFRSSEVPRESGCTAQGAAPSLSLPKQTVAGMDCTS